MSYAAKVVHETSACPEGVSAIYDSPEEAERDIEDALWSARHDFDDRGERYEYGDIPNIYGNVTTEIWVPDDTRYVRWVRMW